MIYYLYYYVTFSYYMHAVQIYASKFARNKKRKNNSWSIRRCPIIEDRLSKVQVDLTYNEKLVPR